MSSATGVARRTMLDRKVQNVLHECCRETDGGALVHQHHPRFAQRHKDQRSVNQTNLVRFTKRCTNLFKIE